MNDDYFPTSYPPISLFPHPLSNSSHHPYPQLCYPCSLTIISHLLPFFTLLSPVFPDISVKNLRAQTMSDDDDRVVPFNLSPQNIETRSPIYRNLYDSFDVRSGLSFCQEFIYHWIHKARKLQISLRSNPKIIVWVDWSRASVYGTPTGSTFTTQVTYSVNGSAVSSQEKFFLLNGSIFFLSHMFNKLNLVHDRNLRVHGATLHFDAFPFANGRKVRFMVLTPLNNNQRLNLEYREFGLEEDLPRPLLLKAVPHHFSVGCLTPHFTEQAPRSIPSNDGLLAWPARASSSATSSPTGNRVRAPPNVTMGAPPMLNPLLAEALNRPPIHPHYWPGYSLFSMPPPGPLYSPTPLPQPLCTVRIPRPQVSTPGGSTSYPVPRKPRRIAPKPSSSSDIDILTVEAPSAPSSTQSVPGPAGGEILSLPLIEGLPAPDSSPPRMTEPTSLVDVESEPPIGDQFQSLQKKRRRNNIA